MVAEPTLQPANDTKVYRPGAPVTALSFTLLAILGAVGLILILLSLKSGAIAPIVCLLVPITAVGIFNWWYMKRTASQTYLAISSSGLEYHTLGLTIRTPWDNVERISDEHLAPRLILRHPSATTQQRPLFVPGRSRSWNEPPADRMIPLHLFGYSQQSELGRDLQRYAPQLFSQHRR